jgi:hypothetical protein
MSEVKNMINSFSFALSGHVELKLVFREANHGLELSPTSAARVCLFKWFKPLKEMFEIWSRFSVGGFSE